MDGKRTLLDWLGLRRTPDWRVARPLGHLVGFALLLFVPLLVIGALAAAGMVLWHTISGGEGATGLGTGALLVGLLGAPFLVWGTVIRHQTLRYQKEGHITDRISKAVEQLGAEKTVKKDGQEETVPNIEVRIGAILSLERIAQDSTAHDNGRDHVRVMEILCAYVRENAPAKSLEPTEPPFKRKTPRIDIQMALDVIKRRSDKQVAIEAEQRYRLDLRGSDLDGCDLSKGKFAGAIFYRCRLEGSDLSWSNLDGSRMNFSLLNFTLFVSAKMRGTILDFCVNNMPDGNNGFSNSTMDGDINGISVVGANLKGCPSMSDRLSMIFGNLETTLPESDDIEFRKFLDMSPRERRESRSEFKHWAPFNSSDLAMGHFRSKFFDSLGISGWPYKDS